MVGALPEHVRHGMIKWEKNCKGQPASIKGSVLDNISEVDEERAEGHQRFCAPDFL